RRDEDILFDPSAAAVEPLDPPGRLRPDAHARLAGDVADLPRRLADVLVDAEVGRHPEVALTARGEADLAADARDAEGADRVPVEVLADDAPCAALRDQRVRVDRPLGLRAGERAVRKPDRALLRDRDLELREASGELRRVLRILDPDAPRRRRRRLLDR